MRRGALPLLEFAIVIVIVLGLWYGPDIVARIGGAPDANERLVMACTEQDQAGFERALADHASATWQNSHGETALMVAAGLGGLDNVRRLVQMGADVNAANDDGLTPLMCAAMQNRVDVMRYLLSHGADPRRKDYFGHTAWQMLDDAQGQSSGNSERVAMEPRNSNPPPWN